MTETIKGSALRESLVGRFAKAAEATPVDVITVLASAPNRDLLRLVGEKSPGSVTELAALAGRAQPNVSRSLNALVMAGLVTIESDGRRSKPSLTEVGQSKLEEIGISDGPGDELNVSPRRSDGRALLVLGPQEQQGNSKTVAPDAISGSVLLRLRTDNDHRVWADSGFIDLAGFATRILQNWWRMLYRRNAPFHISTFYLQGSVASNGIGVSVASSGTDIDIVNTSGRSNLAGRPKAALSEPIESFERHLAVDLIEPIISRCHKLNLYDRPIESLLNRIREAYTFENEGSFCKTAGALGLSPYGMPDEFAGTIQSLISKISDDSARLDFASAMTPDELNEGQEWVSNELSKFGENNSLWELKNIRSACRPFVKDHGERPHERGTTYARAVRTALGLGADVPLGGMEGIRRLMGGSRPIMLSGEAPGALIGFQSSNRDNPSIVMADRNQPAANAFVFSRAIGDFIAFGSDNASVTDLYTARQAVGRAFAAEFIAPAAGVIRMVDMEGASMARVAKHYGAGIQTVSRQYENNYV